MNLSLSIFKFIYFKCSFNIDELLSIKTFELVYKCRRFHKNISPRKEMDIKTKRYLVAPIGHDAMVKVIRYLIG